MVELLMDMGVLKQCLREETMGSSGGRININQFTVTLTAEN